MDRYAWRDLGRRPVFFPAVALGLGAAISVTTPGNSVGFLALALALGGAAAAWHRRVGAHLAVLTALFLGGLGLGQWEARTDIPDGALGGKVKLEGVIEEVLPFPEGGRIQLAVARVQDVGPARFRALLYARGPMPPLEPGQRILVATALRPEQPPANPGQVDTYSPRIRRGISLHGSFEPERLVLLSPPSRWRTWIRRVHEELREEAFRRAPSADAAALYLTLAAGLRSALSADVEDAFAESGLAHILSVSGLHVAALALLALRLGRWLSVRLLGRRRALDPRRPAALAAVPLVWAYVAFTGFQPPAIRSAIMASLVLAGMGLWRRADGLNSLSLAALAIVALDPAAVGSLSLQLSFLAVLSLVLLAPALREAIPVGEPDPGSPGRWRYLAQKAREASLQTLCASAAVTLASVPIVAAAFHRVSLAGLLANVIALPISAALTGLAAGGAAAWVLAPPAWAGPVIWAGTLLSELLVRLATAFSGSELSTALLPSFGGAATGAYLGGLFAFSVARGRWRWLGLAAPAALACAVIPTLVPRAGLDVTFLSVGNGDAIVLSSRGEHALVDGGGVPGGMDTARKFVLPFFRERGIRRLALAVLTHPHADHALGMASALEQVRSAAVWLPLGSEGEPLADRVELAARRSGAEIERVSAGRAPFRLGEATVEVLGPPREDAGLEGPNERSVVLRVTHGEVTLLLPGDVESAGEERLAPGRATIVKVPHHGSASSSSAAFVGEVRPRYAVFCVGLNNRFGFPDPDVVGRWAAAGARCLRTDLHGAVTFHSDGRGVLADTWHPIERWPEGGLPAPGAISSVAPP